MTDLGPAEALRSAAKLMRERAQSASPGPWRCTATSGDVVVEQSAGPHLVADVNPCPDHPAYRSGDAEYVASMHPLVALAVADLLDKIAWMGELDAEMLGRVGCDEAIAIARAYLGETNA